jgi:hypothetical protein
MALDNAVPAPSNNLESLTQWEVLYSALGSGVIPNVGNEFIPSLDSVNRLVLMGTGTALVRGFYTSGSSITSTGAPTASVSPRIDRLVLRLDRTASTAANWIKPVIITGTPGSSPSAPAIQSSLSASGQWDLPICQYRAETNGSLTSLVDERYKLSVPFTVMMSASRPSASPPRIGWEIDTSRLVYSDGTSWHVLVSDTGWVNLSMASGWTQGGFGLATRIRNGICHLSGSVIAASNPTTDKLIASLPAAAKPDKTTEFPVYLTTGAVVQCVAYAGDARAGQLWLVGNAAAVDSGETLSVAVSWPVS